MTFTGTLLYANQDGGNAPPQQVSSTIRDARAKYGVERPVDSLSRLFAGNGFLLADSPSCVGDWSDKDEVMRVYYDEALALARQLLPGAEIAPLTSHTFRREDIKDHHWVDGIQYGPCAVFVHNDYADFVTADRRDVEQSFAAVMDMPTNRRVLGINVWRSVTETPLERFPLAVCDRRSIPADDLVYALNPNAPKPFNAHYCKAGSAHDWFYYPGMTRDEALVFATYDSHPPDGQMFRPTLHTAVAIPGSAGLTPRVSVEVRFFAFL